MFSALVCLTSCDWCDDKYNDETKIIRKKEESKSAGDFMIVNTRTNETLTISNFTTEYLTARIGDTLKIRFNPDSTYTDYSFTQKYSLLNNQTIEVNDLEYDYIVPNIADGMYNITLDANASGDTKDKLWDLTAYGKFGLRIVVPYAKITYKLSCTSVFLEYATPQVTYVGNDGKPVTYTIATDEWTEREDWQEYVEEYDFRSVIVIDGDTIVSEPEKLMGWEKTVQYDNFSVVDDEMKVTYIPKKNIPTGAVHYLEGLSPSLHGEFEYTDDNGKRHTSDINISITININVNGPSSELYGQSLSDIIGNHYNYKGFHIESNGTHEEKGE